MVFYENSGLQSLYDIVHYAQSKKECRRSAFFRHFAEPLQDCNGMCDNCSCTSDVKEIDVSGHAKAIISLLQDLHEHDQRITMLQLVEKVKVKSKGLGPEIKRDELEQLIIQLIVDRVLKEEFQHTAYATNAYVTFGLLARQVLQGKKIIKLEVWGEGKSKGGIAKASKRNLISSGLENKLDELRKELSSVHGGIFPHSILSTQQISFLSAQRPKSIEQLEQIIGKVKTEKYGRRILDVIENYESANPSECNLLEEGQGSMSRAPKKQKTRKALVVIDSSDEEA